MLSIFKMAKKTRSEYIKNLMEDKANLEKSMKEMAEQTAESLLEKHVKETVKNLLKEDEDTFDVEEVDIDTATDDSEDKKGDKGDKDSSKKDSEKDEEEVSAVEDVVGVPATEEEEVLLPAAEDVDDLEQYKDADGEYNLLGMSAEDAVKVLVATQPDGVRIVNNDNGTLTLTDDNTERQYVINLDSCELGGEGCLNEPPIDDDELEFDIDLEEGKHCNESEENLGYTDSYQKNSAMTVPSNRETANPKNTYSMDGGVPTDVERPYAGQGDNQPFDENVNETMTTQEEGPYNRGTGMLHGNTNSKAAIGRNARIGGKQVHGTVDNSYSPAQMEAIKRKANEIFMENKQLKSLLPKIQQRIEESVVIQQSLANIVRLISENSTTRDEKQQIIERFNKVKTREESNKLFSVITEELKSAKPTQNVESIINSQLSESKNNDLTKQPLYQSEELSETLQFMSRLDKIK